MKTIFVVLAVALTGCAIPMKPQTNQPTYADWARYNQQQNQQRTPAVVQTAVKTIDWTCQNNCTAEKYSYQFCLSKCSY